MADERVELKPVEIPGMGRVEDSRLKGHTVRVTHPTLPLERTYCNRCGDPYGWVSIECSEYIRTGEVVVFCNKCDEDLRKIGQGEIPLKVAGDENTREFPELRRGSLPSRLGE